MLLQLDNTVRELKEQKWKLGQKHRIVGELDLFLKNEHFQQASALLEQPQNQLNIDELHTLLQTIIKLEDQKTSLEKSLGVKFTTE